MSLTCREEIGRVGRGRYEDPRDETAFVKSELRLHRLFRMVRHGTLLTAAMTHDADVAYMLR